MTAEKEFLINGTDVLPMGQVETLSLIAGKTLTPHEHVHELTHVDAVTPTYDAATGTYINGSIEHWSCSCGSLFSDEDGTAEITEADLALPYFTIKDNGTYVRVIRYNGADAEVTVPDTVPDNYPDETLRGRDITSVQTDAFRGSTLITKVVMGDNIQKIEWEAFRNCSNLEEIVIGSGLKQIDSNVFADTPSLAKITCTTVTGTINLTRAPFGTRTTLPAFYGMHEGSFRNVCDPDNWTQAFGASLKYYGLDEHDAPVWTWEEDYSAATATFTCGRCDYRETFDATVTCEVSEDGLTKTYTATVEDNNGNLYTDTVTVELPAANGASGSFNDRIKLNFYFDFPAEVLADTGACVILTNESTGRSVTLPVAGAELVPDKGYKFSIPLAAKEAGDTVTAKVLDGQGEAIRLLGKTSGTDFTETGVPYTLMQYFTWLESDGTENEQAIGKAAKDYCSAAMIYFNYNADGVTVSDAVDAVTLAELEDYTAGRDGTRPAVPARQIGLTA